VLIGNTVSAHMSLPEGYSHTSSSVFTITGNPIPTITKTSGDDKIIWNNATKKLDIEAGLPMGSYSIKLKVSNGKTPDISIVFTLWVSETVSEPPFEDVNEDDWFYDAMTYTFSNKLMVGFSETNFGANSSLTRAMAATILYRQAGEIYVRDLQNPFTDVKEEAWYEPAVKWAAHNNIVLGYGDGRFGPEDMVTKEQLAVIIYRAQQSSGNIPPDMLIERVWSDLEKINKWARSEITALTAQGIFADIPGDSFNPQSAATRAETAAMLYRWLTAVEVKAEAD